MTPEERAAEVWEALPFCLDSDRKFYAIDKAWLLEAYADAIRAAVAEEREACACLAEETRIIGAMDIVLCRGDQVAAAIRARGAAVAQERKIIIDTATGLLERLICAALNDYAVFGWSRQWDEGSAIGNVLAFLEARGRVLVPNESPARFRARGAADPAAAKEGR